MSSKGRPALRVAGLAAVALGVWMSVAALVPDAAPTAEGLGLPEPALSELVAGVERALETAAHGALSGASIRVTPRGEVWVVGFRGEEDGATLAELVAAWRGPGDGSLQRVIAAMPAADPELTAHPLSGKTLQRGGSGAAVPNKVRTAAFAVVTLVLGLATGWLLAGGP